MSTPTTGGLPSHVTLGAESTDPALYTLLCTFCCKNRLRPGGELLHLENARARCRDGEPRGLGRCLAGAHIMISR
jgi:hypothetical protein